jgi:hypothetical protein
MDAGFKGFFQCTRKLPERIGVAYTQCVVFRGIKKAGQKLPGF